MTHILCYVDKPWAYFTSKPLAEQWGDDWGDCPYEHNAETPYEDEPGQILKVAYDGKFDEPCEWHSGNSPWSVERINQGACAWLVPARYGNAPPEARPIPAGVTIDEFRRLIALGGGKVYECAARPTEGE
jgi:hypothetical protein